MTHSCLPGLRGNSPDWRLVHDHCHYSTHYGSHSLLTGMTTQLTGSPQPWLTHLNDRVITPCCCRLIAVPHQHPLITPALMDGKRPRTRIERRSARWPRWPTRPTARRAFPRRTCSPMIPYRPRHTARTQTLSPTRADKSHRAWHRIEDSR